MHLLPLDDLVLVGAGLGDRNQSGVTLELAGLGANPIRSVVAFVIEDVCKVAHDQAPPVAISEGSLGNGRS